MDVPLNVAHSVLSSDEPHMSGGGNGAALTGQWTMEAGLTWKNLRGAPLAVTFRTSGVSALQASWPSCPKILHETKAKGKPSKLNACGPALHVQLVEASP